MTRYVLPNKCDWNHIRGIPYRPDWHSSRRNSSSWSAVSKTAAKSSRQSADTRPCNVLRHVTARYKLSFYYYYYYAPCLWQAAGLVSRLSVVRGDWARVFLFSCIFGCLCSLICIWLCIFLCIILSFLCLSVSVSLLAVKYCVGVALSSLPYLYLFLIHQWCPNLTVH